jgi:hypothetical protein
MERRNGRSEIGNWRGEWIMIEWTRERGNRDEKENREIG